MNTSFVVTIQFFQAITVLALLLWPYIRGNDSRYELGGSDRDSEKQALVEALSDIDYEYRTGKISKADYESLQQHYVSEARAVFDDFSAQSERDSNTNASGYDEASIEEKISDVRKELD